MEKEIWKDVKHYEGLYKVSNYGRIWSVAKNDFKVISTKDNGYKFVQLYSHGKMKNEHIHRLVAMAFIPNPNNYPQVNHKDENKANNYVENLEWCTSAYNNAYGTARERALDTRIKNGDYLRASERMKIHNPSRENPKYRGSNSYAKKVSCDGKVFDCLKDCAEYYGIAYSTFRYWMCKNEFPKYFQDKDLHYVK